MDERYLPSAIDFDLIKERLKYHNQLKLNQYRKLIASFSEVPSDKAYQEDATYHEDGKGKFPIRPGDPKDAEDALRLEHHAPADEQPKVHEKACEELKKDDSESYERNCT